MSLETVIIRTKYDRGLLILRRTNLHVYNKGFLFIPLFGTSYVNLLNTSIRLHSFYLCMVTCDYR